ncbi:histidine phosphatase family protein [Enhygromyxa salina]|uniref:Bifunctional RNase H/acid phosphatase n=1 Tax=Enhygromyxa salina TaxID=215803 RepID=A0A2S9XW40_9BACT|nr:histidine phosphatase family protein [Enhygromyxa salina]PRP96931.1 bifunctional RNase H/acid phosphatase [Enhygromyxa salina]
MPRLLLVRHAQSENNLANDRLREEFRSDPERMYAEAERSRQADPALTEAGREQALLLADLLAPTLAAARSLLVSSPMRRALQTATPIAARAGLDRFVCEGDLFEVGGCHYCDVARPSANAAQIEAEFPVVCHGVSTEGWFSGRSASERAEEVSARVDRVIAWTERTLAGGEHDTVVVVAHGDLLSRWLRRWLQIPTTRGLAFVHGNAGITTLSWDRTDGVLVEGLNALDHLPLRLQTGAEAEFWWRYAWPDLASVASRVSSQS